MVGSGHGREFEQPGRLAALPSVRDFLRRTAALRQLTLRSRRGMLRPRLERVGQKRLATRGFPLPTSWHLPVVSQPVRCGRALGSHSSIVTARAAWAKQERPIRIHGWHDQYFAHYYDHQI